MLYKPQSLHYYNTSQRMPETRHFCPHCEETVSLSTFHRHKQLYYDENHHKWVKASEFAQDSEVEDLEDEEIYYDFNDDYISSVEGKR